MSSLRFCIDQLTQFHAEGSGGFPEFCGKLPNDDVMWCAFKVVGVDDRGNTVSRRPKYIFLKWAPSGAPAMRKARAGGHKGAVKQIMNAHMDLEVTHNRVFNETVPCRIDDRTCDCLRNFQAESLEELTEDVIIARLRACGGAHQPTSYEFSNFSVSSPSGKH